MGIDIHSLNFLLYSQKKQYFKNVVTLGRQDNHLPKNVMDKLPFNGRSAEEIRYSEWIFRDILKCDTISSLDNSDYEGATILADMSKPLPEGLTGSYDTVFDGGVLEHIFNVPQALLNISKICKNGGQIIHILPANNFCGHGFWQFSPEMFFSLYSEENGYCDTEVFLASLKNTMQWFQVKMPTEGKRTSSISSEPLYILVRTVRSERDFTHANVQQSDYVHAWSNGEHPAVASSKAAVKNSKPLVNRLRGLLLPKSVRIRQEKSLTRWNPWLEPFEVSTVGIKLR
jgi:SAM-dependent methyltransferase